MVKSAALSALRARGLLLLVTFAIGASPAAWGAEPASVVPGEVTVDGRGMGFTVGYHHIDVSGWRQFLPAGAELSRRAGTFGFDAYSRTGRFRWGGYAQLVVGETTTAGGYITGFAGAQGAFELGYVALDHYAIQITPVMGLGIASLGLTVANEGPLPAADLRAGVIGNETTIGWASFSVEPGVCFDWFPTATAARRRGPRFALRLSWLMALPHAGFAYGGGAITGTESLFNNGFRITLSFGGGTMKQVAAD